MRGKVPSICKDLERVGLTPACAGKRRRPPDTSPARWDHPRMCGEKGCCKFSSRNHSGSPPHMRGKVQLLPVHHDKVGITPACAGKRPRAPCTLATTTDHPRVCGEKAGVHFFLDDYQGSPPRMRGKGIEQSDCRVRVRITPAYAGKSKLTFDAGQLIPGSPPHMRGKDAGPVVQGAVQGITPAYAGKS